MYWLEAWSHVEAGKECSSGRVVCCPGVKSVDCLKTLTGNRAGVASEGCV